MGKISLDDAVVVALGSNLAGHYRSCEALLEAGLVRFRTFKLDLVEVSGLWRSAAWPAGAGPDYLNAVALVRTGLEPRAVLAALMAIERAFGRERGETNGPRTLDLDLIAHGRSVITEPDLRLPHPRAADRLFVMGPLAEIAPGWIHPTLGRTAADLAARASVGLDARPAG